MAEERILIVDDDTSIRTLFQTILEEEGFQVGTASTGKEALQILEEEDYDVALLDVLLPDTNGMLLFNQIKKIRPQLANKVIFISGVGIGVPVVQHLKGLGANFLSKPVDVPDLIQSVANIIQNKVPSGSAAAPANQDVNARVSYFQVRQMMEENLHKIIVDPGTHQESKLWWNLSLAIQNLAEALERDILRINQSLVEIANRQKP